MQCSPRHKASGSWRPGRNYNDVHSANGMEAVALELHIPIDGLIDPEIETMEIREDQLMGLLFGGQ